MTSTRTKARQNLMVAAVNAALERGHFSLACTPFDPVTFEFTIGDMPCIAAVRDGAFIGFVEVHVYAICFPNAYGREHVAHVTLTAANKMRYGAAVVTGILEREKGRYLQEFSTTYRGAPHINERLAEVIIKPNGFGVRPTAHSRRERS